MIYKWIGAVLIVMGCGGFGFAVAASHRREFATLKKLISALDYMECELQYRMSALPDLCRQTAAECDGVLRQIFSMLATELEDQISPDAQQCMKTVLSKTKKVPLQTAQCLQQLGSSLGRFDLKGQLKGLEAARQDCRTRLSKLSENADVRLRSYQTLGLCAGAALVILLM